MFGIQASAQQPLENLDRLINAFYRTPAVRDCFLSTAVSVRDDAKRIVRVRTGWLRDHIFATTGPDLIASDGSYLPNVIVGVNLDLVPYAAIVEFKEDSYLRRAAALEENRIENRVVGELEALIDRVLA